MEHLRDDDDGAGITGDEIVQEQVETHTWNGEEHSKLHLGELLLDKRPDDDRSTPAPSLSLEVDFYNTNRVRSLNKESWERGIEANFALYGIDVNVKRDETLSNRQLDFCTAVSVPFYPFGVKQCLNPTNGFTTLEIAAVEELHANKQSDEYLFVADEPQPDLFMNGRTWGINLFSKPVQGIFAENMYQQRAASIDPSRVSATSYSSKLSLLAAAVEMHEIGHSLNTGREDDRFILTEPHRILNNNEVYSGGGKDRTPELVGVNTPAWSIMRQGWNDELLFGQMGDQYYVFSIEELSTVKP